MAKRTIHMLDDDLDGGPADETVQFELDGAAYTIDLSTVHATALREALGPFVRAANATRRISRPARPLGAAQRRTANTAIREWARAAGYQVGDRGRIKTTSWRHTTGPRPEQTRDRRPTTALTMPQRQQTGRRWQVTPPTAAAATSTATPAAVLPIVLHASGAADSCIALDGHRIAVPRPCTPHAGRDTGTGPAAPAKTAADMFVVPDAQRAPAEHTPAPPGRRGRRHVAAARAAAGAPITARAIAITSRPHDQRPGTDRTCTRPLRAPAPSSPIPGPPPNPSRDRRAATGHTVARPESDAVNEPGRRTGPEPAPPRRPHHTTAANGDSTHPQHP